MYTLTQLFNAFPHCSFFSQMKIRRHKKNSTHIMSCILLYEHCSMFHYVYDLNALPPNVDSTYSKLAKT